MTQRGARRSAPVAHAPALQLAARPPTQHVGIEVPSLSGGFHDRSQPFAWYFAVRPMVPSQAFQSVPSAECFPCDVPYPPVLCT